MIREITIGQYYQTDSVLHRLDPRVKLVATILYIISLFLYRSPQTFAVAGVFLAVCIILSKVPFHYIVRGLKAVVILMLFTAAMNLFFMPGKVIFTYGILKITKEGVEAAVYMAFRLVMLILGSSLMTLTTTPTQLTDAMEKLLWPLTKIGAPVHEVAMMMSIALRFIPILLEETDKIMKAQAARGADFESGNVFHRVRSMVPILVPLFLAAFRRAGDLAMAMEARCYQGGEGRTKMKPLRYAMRDTVAYLILIAYITMIVLAGKLL
ncbi:MAG: energy-coupling factor transporter transmembrane protein EcfT [Lachnospiraceae bacterium]|nr:energy-coupling factor transporter transmembrane protein EcfT [Lachnospiraceae bacterium]